MTKINLLLFTLFIIPFHLFAADEQVNDNAFLVQKEIAIWSTSAARTPVYTCQAIRIHPKWLLTAAHCVYSACKAGAASCNVRVTLAQAELLAQATVRHDSTTQNVFVYDGFFPGQNKISSVDVALIRLDSSASYNYFVAGQDSWNEITKEKFDKLLRESPETKMQLNAVGGRLVSVATAPNSRSLQRIAVPRVGQGDITWLESPSSDVYFLNGLQHFISPGFGVRKGNSGGGVFTFNGDLVGIVSSLVYAQDGSASFQGEDGGAVVTLKNARNYFLFTGFNGTSLNFIRNHVPNVRTVGALPNYMEQTDKDFAAIVGQINKTFMSF